MVYGQHVQAHASLTSAASSSATLWAAISGARFHIESGFVSILTPAATGAAINIMETDADGTVAATLFSVPHATAGFYWLNLGEHGFTASAIDSRLVWENTGDALINGVFVGYHR